MSDTQTTQTESTNRQIARATGSVMIAIVVSQLLSLVATSLLGSTIGTSHDNDAFLAANRIPEFLFNLISGGALGSAFIPVFTGLITNEKRKDAWKLASSLINLVLLVLTLLGIGVFIFAEPVVHNILAPGFAAKDPQIEALTVELMRIQLPSAILFGVSGLLMGILNTYRHFLMPALAPGMYQLGIILGLLILYPNFGVQGVAWGVLIGSLLYLLLLITQMLQIKDRQYLPTLGLDSAEVREVGILMAPRLLGVAIVQINFVVNTIIASWQPEGSITAVAYGFRLMYMPLAAIAQAAAIAALPSFSAQVAKNDLPAMRSSLAATVRGVLLLAVPASIGLIILREPIVRLIFERNAFDTTSTVFVTWALLWYAIGLVGHSVVEIFSRAFYALHDTRTPVFVLVGAMSLNLVLSIVLSNVFTNIGWMPHGALALANSFATALECSILIIIMRKKLDGISGSYLWNGFIKAVIAAGIMGLAVSITINWLPINSALIQTAVGVLIGGLVYFILLILLKTEELHKGLQLVKSRFFNR